MTVKYHCQKCGKRYVDWGAEKNDFKCPGIDSEDKDKICEGKLVPINSAEEKPVKRPSLKRKSRRVAPPISTVDDEVLAPEIEEIEEEEEVEPDERVLVENDLVEPIAETEFDLEEAVVPADVEDADDAELDVTEDLDFGESAPGIAEEPIEGPLEEGDEWPA